MNDIDIINSILSRKKPIFYKTILNEIYFGRTNLVKKLDVYMDRLIKYYSNHNSIDSNNRLHNKLIYDLDIETKRKNFIEFGEDIDTILDKDIKNTILQSGNYKIDLNCFNKNTRLYKIITDLNLFLQFLFGFNRVYVCIDLDDLKPDNFMQNMLAINIYPKNRLVLDAHNRKLRYMDDLYNSLIVSNNSIRINNRKYSVNLYIIISYKAFHSHLFSRECLSSMILHEIGHAFARLLINDNQLSYRVDEKFADGFVALYGYSLYRIQSLYASSQLEDISHYYDYITNNKNTVEQDIDGAVSYYKDTMEYRRNYHNLYNQNHEIIQRNYIDPHPSLHSRILSQINQLQSELKYSKEYLSNIKLYQLNKDIVDCNKLINLYKSNSDSTYLTHSKVPREYQIKVRTHRIENEHNYQGEHNEELIASEVITPYKITNIFNHLYKNNGKY